MITKEWSAVDQGHYPHRWEHGFDPSVSLAERAEWLSGAISQSKLNGVELIVKETLDGYEFGFKEVDGWTGFVMENFGSMESVGGHFHTETFPSASEPNPYFVKAADAYLTAMGIEFTRTVDGNEVSYEFKSFLDRATFQWMTESGELDRMADQLSFGDDFQRRFEAVKQEVDAAFEMHP